MKTASVLLPIILLLSLWLGVAQSSHGSDEADDAYELNYEDDDSEELVQSSDDSEEGDELPYPPFSKFVELPVEFMGSGKVKPTATDSPHGAGNGTRREFCIQNTVC